MRSKPTSFVLIFASLSIFVAFTGQSVFAREIVMQDSKVLVAFDSNTGALTRLVSKTTNWTIERRPDLGISFRVLVPLPDRQDNFVLGQKQHP